MQVTSKQDTFSLTKHESGFSEPSSQLSPDLRLCPWATQSGLSKNPAGLV